jgi:hypothetical protein
MRARPTQGRRVSAGAPRAAPHSGARGNGPRRAGPRGRGHAQYSLHLRAGPPWPSPDRRQAYDLRAHSSESLPAVRRPRAPPAGAAGAVLAPRRRAAGARPRRRVPTRSGPQKAIT